MVKPVDIEIIANKIEELYGLLDSEWCNEVLYAIGVLQQIMEDINER